MVSFFEDPDESLEEMDVTRQVATEEMAARHPDVDVAVLFRAAAKAPPAVSSRPPETPTA
jgi:hypothetical protein